jgi:hypothetical protein
MLRSVRATDGQCWIPWSKGFGLRKVSITYLRTVAAAVVETVHAPPAMTFLHDPQFHIPTAVLFTESYQSQMGDLQYLVR